jgi:hypothetical protein
MMRALVDGGQPRLKAVGVREDAQRRKDPWNLGFLICDLRFFEQRAKQGSLTIESEGMRREAKVPKRRRAAALQDAGARRSGGG